MQARLHARMHAHTHAHTHTPSLGGDLSFHLEKDGRFLVPRVKLYLAELALALEYLREKKIIHRDVKPANVLLDSEGHAHLTDFNVACLVRPGVPATSVTGTKPYMGKIVLCIFPKGQDQKESTSKFNSCPEGPGEK